MTKPHIIRKMKQKTEQKLPQKEQTTDNPIAKDILSFTLAFFAIGGILFIICMEYVDAGWHHQKFNFTGYLLATLILFGLLACWKKNTGIGLAVIVFALFVYVP